MAFAEIPYIIPPGFPNFEQLRAKELVPGVGTLPGDDVGEIEIIEIEGMPKIREYALFHRPSKTTRSSRLVVQPSSRSEPLDSLFSSSYSGYQ